MSNPVAKTFSDGTTAEATFKSGANKTDRVRILAMHKEGKSVEEIATYTRVHPDVVGHIVGD